jgi:hypothetical protein
MIMMHGHTNLKYLYVVCALETGYKYCTK